MNIPSYPTGFLTLDQASQYWRDGCLVIKDCYTSEEIRCWRKECRRLWESVEVDKSNPRIQWREHADGDEVADRIDPVLDISPEFQHLANDERLLKIVSDVLHTEPEIFKMKLISKWPGTAGYKMHQDYTYWAFVGDVPSDHFVNVLIPLDKFTATSGATELFPGLHDHRLDPPPDEPYDVDEEKMDLSQGMILELNPGDIALFHGMTPHRSGTNTSDHNRESLFITYVRAGHSALYERYYAGRQQWLDGQ